MHGGQEKCSFTDDPPRERIAMDAIPEKKVDPRFQEMMARLVSSPGLSLKQQIELQMTRRISVEMLKLAETMRDGGTDMETCLILLKYATVIEFVLTALADQRDIAPPTLRMVFRLAGIDVDEDYPE
jgi:hypothetical protein